VGSLLALTSAEIELLAPRSRARLGWPSYGLRMAAFLLATAPLLRHALPTNLRQRAIRPFLYALMPGPAENLLYARGLAAVRRESAGG
jgi:hypothetical protein